MGHKYMYKFEMDTELKECSECPLDGRCSATEFGSKFNVGIPNDCPLDYIHIDEHGCRHDGGIGWNPQGAWCGECTSNAGPDCPSYTLDK